MFNIMIIKLEPRISVAPTVQEILTKYGCIIHTRLGLHEATKDTCANSGLIILNLMNEEKEQINKLKEELEILKGVTTKLIEI
ncbi:hypothetical protein [uncultured Clostridium sp.]|uniref:hypothetical protein n=1 Tax=uncultured Clostridium sp. TaxID=59620 RepID=UPI002582E18C|nr:hypothetical protein [uncultured Clostridium sp.]